MTDLGIARFPTGALVQLRCDAGERHGLGHLSRCMTLAKALAAVGATPHLVLNAPETVHKSVSDEGYRVVAAPSDVARDHPEDWQSAAAVLVIIDSKDATAGYVDACSMVCPVACFDDDASRDLPCDVLVNNNIWAVDSDYPSRPQRTLLCGPQYNTVDPAYFNYRGLERQGILITLGGEDPHNHTYWLIDALAEELGSMPVHICIGPAHPDPDAVVQLCERVLPCAAIYIAPPSLRELVASCHIALSAAGTTCYELAAAGVGMAILAVEAHQYRLAMSMVKADAALNLGGFDTVTKQGARDIFHQLVDPATRSRIAENAAQLFPMPGAISIAQVLAPRARHRG